MGGCKIRIFRLAFVKLGEAIRRPFRLIERFGIAFHLLENLAEIGMRSRQIEAIRRVRRELFEQTFPHGLGLDIRFDRLGAPSQRLADEATIEIGPCQIMLILGVRLGIGESLPEFDRLGDMLIRTGILMRADEDIAQIKVRLREPMAIRCNFRLITHELFLQWQRTPKRRLGSRRRLIARCDRADVIVHARQQIRQRVCIRLTGDDRFQTPNHLLTGAPGLFRFIRIEMGTHLVEKGVQLVTLGIRQKVIHRTPHRPGENPCLDGRRRSVLVQGTQAIHRMVTCPFRRVSPIPIVILTRIVLMRVAHFDCFSGISGDMTLGALVDAGVPAEVIADGLASLGLPITMRVEKQKRNGIAASRVLIDAPDEASHRHLPDIEAILAKGSLTTAQFDLTMKIFRRLGEAEAASHGIAIEKVHFPRSRCARQHRRHRRGRDRARLAQNRPLYESLRRHRIGHRQVRPRHHARAHPRDRPVC